MPVTTYQVNRDLNGDTQAQNEAFQILASVAQNATEGYHLVIQDVSLDGVGRLRIKLSDALPDTEVTSFAGDIIAV